MYSTRIVEYGNARFLENDEISESEKSQRINFDIEEIQVLIVQFMLDSFWQAVALQYCNRIMVLYHPGPSAGLGR
ncbi:hypothetical protein MUK42_02250 [Musa troglodytarum]|uniref:Uncharacterized protein n=1 Tax=Musa troglodytarum TaxID=320322 RepID=A0A9E7G605_9LILI|nr:hypothetical protein MUK42_02250 [Musa troglodytarum]